MQQLENSNLILFNKYNKVHLCIKMNLDIILYFLINIVGEITLKLCAIKKYLLYTYINHYIFIC